MQNERLVRGIIVCFILTVWWIVPAHGQELTSTELMKTAREARQHGQYDVAERNFRLVLAKADGQHPPTIETVLCVADLGEVLLTEGHFAEPEKLFDRGLRMLEADSTLDPRYKPFLLGNLGVLYQRTGQFTRAEASLKEALVLAQKYFGAEDSSVAILLNHLGTLYTAAGKNRRAEDNFKKAMALTSQKSVDPMDLAVLQTNFANLYRIEKKWALSESLLLSAMHTIEGAAGTDHPSLIPTLDGLSGLYYERHNPTDAENVLRRALQIQRKTFGPDSLGAALRSASLAEVLTERGKYSEAETLFHESLAIQEHMSETKTIEYARTLEMFAGLLHRTKSSNMANELDGRVKSIRLELEYSISANALRR